MLSPYTRILLYNTVINRIRNHVVVFKKIIFNTLVTFYKHVKDTFI